MPKMKTKKAAAKRIKISGGGVLLRRHSSGAHLKVSKSKGRIRRQHGDVRVSGPDSIRFRKLLPYS